VSAADLLSVSQKTLSEDLPAITNDFLFHLLWKSFVAGKSLSSFRRTPSALDIFFIILPAKDMNGIIKKMSAEGPRPSSFSSFQRLFCLSRFLLFF